MRRRSHQVALLVVAVMLAHMASMTSAALAMHAGDGQSRASHAGAHHAGPDSLSLDALAAVHAAFACVDIGELATMPPAPLTALIASDVLPVEMRRAFHPGDFLHTVRPEPPPPDAAVRRALLQVFLN